MHTKRTKLVPPLAMGTSGSKPIWVPSVTRDTILVNFSTQAIIVFLLFLLFPLGGVLQGHAQCHNDRGLRWDFMTTHNHVLVAIVSCPWGKSTQAKRLIQNLTHETEEIKHFKIKHSSLITTHELVLRAYVFSLSPHSPPTSFFSSSNSLS